MGPAGKRLLNVFTRSCRAFSGLDCYRIFKGGGSKGDKQPSDP